LSGVILFGGQPLIAPLEARGASNSILVSQLEQSLTHASRITHHAPHPHPHPSLQLGDYVHLVLSSDFCSFGPTSQLPTVGESAAIPIAFCSPATSSRGTRQTLRPASFSISPALSQHLSAPHVVSACTEIFLSWSLGRSSFLSTANQKRIWFPDTYS